MKQKHSLTTFIRITVLMISTEFQENFLVELNFLKDFIDNLRRFFINKTDSKFKTAADPPLEPSQISTVELSAQIVKSFDPTVFAKTLDHKVLKGP